MVRASPRLAAVVLIAGLAIAILAAPATAKSKHRHRAAAPTRTVYGAPKIARERAPRPVPKVVPKFVPKTAPKVVRRVVRAPAATPRHHARTRALLATPTGAARASSPSMVPWFVLGGVVVAFIILAMIGLGGMFGTPRRRTDLVITRANPKP